MTGPAKVLVVLITVFAIGLATMSSLLFAKREDFQAKLAQSEDFRARERATINDYRARMEAEIVKTRAERDAHRARATDLELKYNTLMDLDKQVRNDLTTKANELSNVNATIQVVMANYEKRAAELDVLQAKKQELLDQLAAKTREYQDLDQKAQALQSAKVALENSLTKTQTDLATMTATADRQQQTLDSLYAKQVDTRPIIDAMPMPNINGKVLYVEKGSDLVVVNVGTDQGVRKNFEFTIYRDGSYVGKMRIVALQDNDMAAGRVINLKEGATVQRGDSVGTQINM